MMTILILLILIIGFVTSNPFPNTLDNRLTSQIQKGFLLSAEDRLDTINKNSNKANGTVENVNKTLSTLKYATEYLKATDSEIRDKKSHEKQTIEQRHKAVFIDYPLISHIAYYSKIPMYEVGYNANSDIATKDISRKESYQESDIFYIRLPPTPIIFIPNLGYISQSSMYSSAVLTQVPLVSQLLQILHTKFGRPQPTSQQTVNSFIKLPVDFISNGKPLSIYQWQKKPNKKPTNSPITNLDNLSADFVSNGKPISIYQWQTNFKPKKSDDSFNSLDAPYIFNGKLTSMYLLGVNGSTSMHQSIQYPDY